MGKENLPVPNTHILRATNFSTPMQGLPGLWISGMLKLHLMQLRAQVKQHSEHVKDHMSEIYLYLPSMVTFKSGLGVN